MKYFLLVKLNQQRHVWQVIKEIPSSGGGGGVTDPVRVTTLIVLSVAGETEWMGILMGNFTGPDAFR
jgi:hypothetical protein